MTTATDRKETNAEYHADTAYYSHSMLEVYRKSPALFEAIYITRTLPRPSATPAMVIGSLLHCLVLEPDKFLRLYFVAEGCKDRRSKMWKAAVDVTTGLECVLPSQVEEATRMAVAVQAHPLAAKLLAMEGVSEESIRWGNADEISPGLLLKCKPDRLITDGSLDYILYVELKTSITPAADEFAKQAYNLGYHRQAGHYCDGITAKYHRNCRPIFIVVGKDAPHDVHVYQPDNEFIKQGMYENIVTLAALDNSLRRHEWRGENQNELQTLSLPPWARRKIE